MKTAFLSLLTIILTFESFAQQTKVETIYFDHDLYNLTPSATTTLQNLYSFIKTGSYDRIKIFGHTDGDGSDSYNLTLSKNRTKAVHDYFISMGIAKYKIQIQNYGETKPIIKSDNEQDKQRNRRVEIILEKGVTSDNNNIGKQAQLFSIPSNKDTTLICNEGTIIKIKANSFVSQQTGQSISEQINFIVAEYYKISDILLSNLSTTSGGQLLETAGMVKINAISNNQDLTLSEGKSIEISFPTKTQLNDMKLFSGSWVNESHINWTEQKARELDKSKGEEVFITVEQMPEFKGGSNKLFEYLTYGLKYPEEAKNLGLEGTVFISFVINEKGEVKEPNVVRGLTPELNNAAIETIRNMPNWVPGKQNGQNVSVQYTLPVKFMLNNSMFIEGEGTFKERFEKLYSDSSMQNANSGTLMYYVLQSTELGWINCDRFININPKVNYVIELEKDIESVRIIFDRYKSIMDVFPDKGKYSFNGVPLGEKITIVAIKRVNNIPYLALKESRTSNKTEKDLIFKRVTMDTLKKEIIKLDKFN